MMAVSQALIDQYHETGLLIVENVLTPDELAAMRERAEQIARGDIP